MGPVSLVPEGAVRDLTLTNIKMCVSRLATWGTCVRLDALCLAYQISLVPKTVSFIPEQKNDT
jgi:hypothetical protein